MGLLFRRRVRIARGIYLNFSTGGMSLTAGVPGASVNVGSKGAYLNAGLPGMGVYSRQKLSGGARPSSEPGPAELPAASERGEIKSGDVESLTGMEFEETKQLIIDAYRKRAEIESNLSSERMKLFALQFLNIISKVLIFGFFVKWFGSVVMARKAIIQELEVKRDECIIDLDTTFDPESQALFSELVRTFEAMTSSAKIWDKTSSVDTDRVRERTSASATIQRSRVKFAFGDIPVLKSTHKPFHLGNANGPELFFYPAFVLSRKGGATNIGIVGYKELEFEYLDRRFVETESCPPDAKRVGETWKKVNKDGGRDRRFKENYQIPILLYGEFSFRSATGLNECFLISNSEAAKGFAAAFSGYQRAVAN